MILFTDIHGPKPKRHRSVVNLKNTIRKIYTGDALTRLSSWWVRIQFFCRVNGPIVSRRESNPGHTGGRRVVSNYDDHALFMITFGRLSEIQYQSNYSYPITTRANSAMNHSEFLEITCNLLKAREKSRVQSDFSSAFQWWKNWREILYQPLNVAIAIA